VEEVCFGIGSDKYDLSNASACAQRRRAVTVAMDRLIVKLERKS